MSPEAHPVSAPVEDRRLAFMDGHGELATMMRGHDWGRSAVGEPDTWPASLRTVLQIVMTSRYAMWMAWGPELTFFCNDAYRPTLGAKQDWLGAPAAKVWDEIWSDIGPRIDHVLETGDATWDEGLLLFLERNGFPEETYHTFSYSPLADDAGSIAGMLCVVTEVTERVISERRLHLLRDLAPRIGGCQTRDALWASVAATLENNDRDLPMVTTYLFDGANESAYRTLASGGAEAPQTAGGDWPLELIRHGAAEVVVDDLTGIHSRGWNVPSKHALLVPIAGQNQDEPIGAFVAGLNPYRPFDADYRAFIGLFVGQVSAGLVTIDNLQAERRRVEALAAIDRAKTAFFSNVSHEFRTPLTLMLGPIEDALADEAPATAQHERLTVAHRNSRRLLRLVNSLLDFARIESGRDEARFRPTDLALLTADLASSFRSATDKAGLALIVEAPSLSEPLFVDADLWEKIVLNLLSNAFKFTFEGEIVVSVKDGGDGRARLVVRDTGTGIAASELPRVFERFHRVEGAVGRSFEGSGIGLALVQQLVHQHGGTIEVESVLATADRQGGTAFIVTIPFGAAHLPPERVFSQTSAKASSRGQSYVDEALRWLPDADASAIDDEGLTASSIVDPSADGERPRVLLADDNADLREYIGRLLGERGYEVATVANGVEALEHSRRNRPDLLITDVMMPRLDGFGLVAAIREDATLRDLPIIMLSARAGEEARIDGLAAGADDYLVKPFSARELIARVSATIGMSRVRKEAADAIRDTEARSAAVLEGMTEGYVLVDRDFHVVQINAEALRIHGLHARDAIGRHYPQLWPQVATADHASALNRAMAERIAVTLADIAVATGDGESWMELRAYPAGEGLALFQRDITEQKRNERALRAFNETLEEQVAERTRERDRTWNNSQDLLLIIDHDGLLRAVNPAWTTVLGYRSDELIGHHVREFIHPDDQGSSAVLTQATESRVPQHENRYRHRDGSFRWISWVASHEGDLTYASGRNVTAEKEASLELEVAQEQLRQSQKMEAVGQLTGGLAHDFNNLLTGITGSLELLQIRMHKGQVADVDRYVNAAQGAARRAAALTHRLLAFSRRQTLDPKPTDVNRLIAELEDLVRRTVGMSVELEVIGAAGLWPALVDQNQLESALLNLCINGRDAMPDGGRLTIETSNKWLDDRAARERDLPPGQYLSICVTDNGTGMTPDVVQRAFDPFFTTKPLGAGTGLGLSMVYGFARQSGGQVRIYSELGQGTTICIYLPRHAAVVAVEHEQHEVDQGRAPVSASGHTVLVVDDEPTVRMLVMEVLESMGCATIEASDGPAALKVLQSSSRIDLLVTDVGLPGGINGRQVADGARKLRPGLKTLFITGYAENAALGNGYLDEGMQVLTKPFTLDTLSRRVGDLLERH